MSFPPKPKGNLSLSMARERFLTGPWTLQGRRSGDKVDLLAGDRGIHPLLVDVLHQQTNQNNRPQWEQQIEWFRFGESAYDDKEQHAEEEDLQRSLEEPTELAIEAAIQDDQQADSNNSVGVELL